MLVKQKNIETCCILDRKQTNLTLSLKSYEHLPATFESEGSINSRFKGRELDILCCNPFGFYNVWQYCIKEMCIK